MGERISTYTAAKYILASKITPIKIPSKEAIRKIFESLEFIWDTSFETVINKYSIEKNNFENAMNDVPISNNTIKKFIFLLDDMLCLHHDYDLNYLIDEEVDTNILDIFDSNNPYSCINSEYKYNKYFKYRSLLVGYCNRFALISSLINNSEYYYSNLTELICAINLKDEIDTLPQEIKDRCDYWAQTFSHLDNKLKDIYVKIMKIQSDGLDILTKNYDVAFFDYNCDKTHSLFCEDSTIDDYDKKQLEDAIEDLAEED